MKATEAKFLDFLNRSPQFVIPIYQRTYSWTVAECQELWDDIIRAGSNEGISAHFVGWSRRSFEGSSTRSHSRRRFRRAIYLPWPTQWELVTR